MVENPIAAPVSSTRPSRDFLMRRAWRFNRMTGGLLPYAAAIISEGSNVSPEATRNIEGLVFLTTAMLAFDLVDVIRITRQKE